MHCVIALSDFYEECLNKTLSVYLDTVFISTLQATLLRSCSEHLQLLAFMIVVTNGFFNWTKPTNFQRILNVSGNPKCQIVFKPTTRVNCSLLLLPYPSARCSCVRSSTRWSCVHVCNSTLCSSFPQLRSRFKLSEKVTIQLFSFHLLFSLLSIIY